jgi:hypothetical protein
MGIQSSVLKKSGRADSTLFLLLVAKRLGHVFGVKNHYANAMPFTITGRNWSFSAR